MSRPAIVYLSMLLLLFAGLWLVLACGRRLSAPEDLAGKWQIQMAGGDSHQQGLGIDQSGVRTFPLDVSTREAK